MLILSMLFAPFRPPRPQNTILPFGSLCFITRKYRLLGRQAKACLYGCSGCKCGRQRKQDATFFALDPGENRWRSARYGLRCWKRSSGMGRTK